ncbi:hypothetical protein JANAI62_25040 [Jannaschia pagri]|uniref:YihY family inner membrane protein n=1 Tax=Jannaschia pagri TaxID=2829797 RepID=A0ABQ4NNG0_9RHOB|nr:MULTISPECIES: YihY/virulence factor BrkB family protein [unclassified Jannaschia]GIT92047.1 hypothetical protein JANAI61_25050 [Jannaschia sp. AI_61]GIT95881.1 hypothetical protein JANAI62_25040 [Jannaschia sp. AI_62]
MIDASSTLVPKSIGQTGRGARRPSQIPLRGVFQVAKRVTRRLMDTQLSLISAGVAFFGLLAVFPALSALVALGGVLLTPVEIATQIDPLLATLPPAAAEIISGQLSALAATSNDTLSWTLALGLLIAVFSASRGTLNLMTGLNVAYEERERRNFFVVQIMALMITVVGLIGFVLTLATVAVLPFIAQLVGENSLTAQLILIARWPFLVAVAVFSFGALYKFGPSRRPARWRWVTPGAALAVAVWLGATVGFSWYVSTFGTYAETFGALAGVIVLMLWLFLSSFALLLGALVDAELEAQTAADSTIGPARPIGHRGAVKADTVEGR